MKILKFGGTSVESAERILSVIAIIKAKQERKETFAVVVSALSGVTDSLIETALKASTGEACAKEILDLEKRHLSAAEVLLPVTIRSRTLAGIKSSMHDLEELIQGIVTLRECSAKTLDQIMSFGERLSASIIAEALSAHGVPARFVDARTIIRTDNSFGSAQVDFTVSNPLIISALQDTKTIPVITGFISSTAKGETTTLGRGGSDYTASVLAAAVQAEEIEIWTDVDGIMTADPRFVATAIPIPHLSYEEAMELSHFGAKVIYPPTIQPAYTAGIPVRILNTGNPAFPGSVIHRDVQPDQFPVTGISSIAEVALLRIEGAGMQGVTGTAGRVFEALSTKKINVILITQASSEHTICLAVLPKHASLAVQSLSEEFEYEIERARINPIVVEHTFSILSVVGENMRRVPGISAKLFQALGSNGVNVAAIAQGSSERNISVVIDAKDRGKALNAVHDTFFLSDLRTAHLFILGQGLIAKTLLRQIQESASFLKERYHLSIRLCGISDSKRMAITPTGIKKWTLSEIESQPASLPNFINQMIEMNLPHCILVDCTAAEDVPEHYSKALDASISVITPNKRSIAGPFIRYEKLKAVERKRSVRFLYETCVGAGLPILGTLNDLLKSGDEIKSIQAVLSGTLSYLFNSYNTDSPSFASVIREAKDLGYTEPDPREDLSGLDVGRKLLILAREIGMQLELEDIEIESLVPQKAQKATSVEDFFKAIETEDGIFKTKLSEATACGGKLIYIAELRDGRAKASLQVITSEHPLWGLSGSDNSVAFVTKRYNTRALVVQGPGAGPEVTAAGVFADIIRVVQ